MKTINQKIEVTNYPYGYKKTSAFFSIEFKKGKGFRSVFQTLNPKTGRLNAEKKGTYSELMYLEKDEKGFVNYKSIGLNSFEGTNAGCKFINENFDLFTTEQIKDIAVTMLALSGVGVKCKVIYCGSKFEDLKPLVDSQIKVFHRIIKEGANYFNEINFDIDALKKTEIEGFNPFTIKKSEPVSLMSLIK